MTVATFELLYKRLAIVVEPLRDASAAATPEESAGNAERNQWSGLEFH